MHYPSLFGCLVALLPLLPMASPLPALGEPAIAVKPATVFSPYLDRIRQTLPPNFVMRLPAQIRLGEPADSEVIEQFKVRVFASGVAPGLTVGLYTCEDMAQFCLVGTFSVAHSSSAIARQEFRLHQAAASPITLTNKVHGYLLEGAKRLPSSLFSSVMWQQDQMLYHVSFASPERQNMLYMAVSMANSSPIASLNPELRDAPIEVKPPSVSRQN
ncbi:hypothetical protein ACN4EK_23780 [Pantanalinema rosaneae CENA516]|uniref:hypothetical protein n=1 Tax=Pantanalinema rosaneae TaxID=1620701 RepID=UPI003D6EBABE